MISEVAFATQYASLWHILAPNSERFVRRLNLNLKRYRPESSHADETGRRGFLNEIAFQLAYLKTTKPNPTIEEASAIARSNLSRLDHSQQANLTGPSTSEIEIVAAIEQSLLSFAQKQAASSAEIIFKPTFPGCGFLDASVGDLIVGDALFEVKAGDRLFRSTDLRQLVTYCAVNFASKKYPIKQAGCVNPRRGTYFLLDLDTLSYQMSGKPAADLFGDMIYYLSSSGISR